MRVRSITLIAILISVAVAILVGPWTAAASTSGHHLFTVVAKDSEATLTPADFGASFAPNQQATEDAPVYRHGHWVGLAETIITVTRVAGDDVVAIIECSVELPEGNIFFNGSFHFADFGRGARVPVLGGTGSYAGFTGKVTLKAATDNSATTLAFDISRP